MPVALISAGFALCSLFGSANSDDQILGGVLSRRIDPGQFRDLLAGNSGKVIEALKHSVDYDPNLDVNLFLAELNFTWGNYDDAVYFADRSAISGQDGVAVLQVECAARYSRGDSNVIEALLPRFPQAQQTAMYGEVEKVLFAHPDLGKRKAWLRHELLTAPARAFSFINAVLAHPKYSPSVEEFCADISEITRFFEFKSGISLDNVDVKAKAGPRDYYVDDQDQYFYATLISLDLAAVCGKLGLEKEQGLWKARQRQACSAAENARQLTAPRRHRLEMAEKRFHEYPCR